MDRILALLGQLDGSGSDSEWQAVEHLRAELGVALVPHLRSLYESSTSWQIRSSCVYHAVRHARESDEAISLGLKAVRDSSQRVRYRACMLLAYSLRADLLEELKSLVADGGSGQDDLLAAIDAIEHQNHHYFADRTHSGMVRLNIR